MLRPKLKLYALASKQSLSSLTVGASQLKASHHVTLLVMYQSIPKPPIPPPRAISCVRMNWSFVLFCFFLRQRSYFKYAFHCSIYLLITSVTRFNTTCTRGRAIPLFSCKHHNLTHYLQFSSKPSNICIICIFISSSEFPHCAE